MHPEHAPDGTALLGESLDDAVATAVDRTDHSEQAVRFLLDTISVDGRVSADRLDEVLGETATYVSTPETRLEFADRALADVLELAHPHADVPTVDHRHSALQTRYTELEAAVAGLASDLQSLLADASDPGDLDDLLETIERLRDVRERADRFAGRADELAEDIDAFERWLTVPVARHEAIELDLDDLEETLDEFTERELEGLPTAQQRQLARHHRVLGLVVDDVRQELADVRTLDHRAGADTSETVDEIVFRLDDLGSIHQTCIPPRDVLEDETVADIEVLDDAFGSLDAPFDWAHVEDVLSSLDAADERIEAH